MGMTCPFNAVHEPGKWWDNEPIGLCFRVNA